MKREEKAIHLARECYEKKEKHIKDAILKIDNSDDQNIFLMSVGAERALKLAEERIKKLQEEIKELKANGASNSIGVDVNIPPSMDDVIATLKRKDTGAQIKRRAWSSSTTIQDVDYVNWYVYTGDGGTCFGKSHDGVDPNSSDHINTFGGGIWEVIAWEPTI